jgi:hypothetical protein
MYVTGTDANGGAINVKSQTVVSGCSTMTQPADQSTSSTPTRARFIRLEPGAAAGSIRAL